jgi:hypothetical protein
LLVDLAMEVKQPQGPQLPKKPPPKKLTPQTKFGMVLVGPSNDRGWSPAKAF